MESSNYRSASPVSNLVSIIDKFCIVFNDYTFKPNFFDADLFQLLYNGCGEDITLGEFEESECDITIEIDIPNKSASISVLIGTDEYENLVEPDISLQQGLKYLDKAFYFNGSKQIVFTPLTNTKFTSEYYIDGSKGVFHILPYIESGELYQDGFDFHGSKRRQ